MPVNSDLCAVVVMASMISMILCRAESAPIVMSVPQKSLSIDPTRPTMLRCVYCWAKESVILPDIEVETKREKTSGNKSQMNL